VDFTRIGEDCGVVSDSEELVGVTHKVMMGINLFIGQN